MNVVVTGGGTIAPIDDVRPDRQRLVGPVLGRDHRGLPRPRGARSGTSTPPRPSSRSLRSPGFDLDAADPDAELARLDRAPATTGGRSATGCTSVPLRDGTVADYAETLERVLLRASRSTSPSWRWPSPTSSPSPIAGKIDSEAESLIDPLPARRPR